MRSKKFKDLLRQARQSRGLSQAALAKKTGLQPAAISHFETGRRSPSFKNLRKLCLAMKLDADDLIGRVHETAPEHMEEPRIKELISEAQTEGIAINQESLSDLKEILGGKTPLNFILENKAVRILWSIEILEPRSPSIFLLDNGNFRIKWTVESVKVFVELLGQQKAKIMLFE